MSKFKDFINKIRNHEDFADIRTNTIRDILNGNILTKKIIRKQYLLMLLLVVLIFFYINNRYMSEKQITKIASLKKEIVDLKYESLTISAELMEITKQSNILKLMEQKGMTLKPGDTPPIVLKK